jgi:hypothetical protein
MLKPSVLTILRCLFAFFGVNERYGDVSTVEKSAALLAAILASLELSCD